MFGSNAKNAISANKPSVRAELDFYCTDPMAVEALLSVEKMSNSIWECAAGAGHISNVLINHGYDVRSTDIADRNIDGVTPNVDFLSCTEKFDGSILTNPPFMNNGVYNFVKKAFELVVPKSMNKIIMYSRVGFLESVGRYEGLFKNNPPRTVYLFPKRPRFGKYGKMECSSNSEMHCWCVWDTDRIAKSTEIKWLMINVK